MNKFEYKPFIKSLSNEDLLEDLKKVALENNKNIITMKFYSDHGLYDVTNIAKRFGTWQKALLLAGLKPGNICNYTDEDLFENILIIWQFKGKQPVRRDLAFSPSKISQGPYNRRFKSWSEALKCFVEYANENETIIISSNNSNNNSRKTNRDPSLRLRFNVLKRDNFSCVQCGASPAKDSSVELHIDHMKPWSKGGETILDNLQTLCIKCNLGKSNLE